MKLELKNVKVHEDMSEETTCFSATLWVNGKRAASCRNDGIGGSTHVCFDNHATRDEVVRWCKDNPIVQVFRGKKFECYGVDDRVDELLFEYMNKEMLKKNQKKMLVLHQKCLNDPKYIIHAYRKFKSPIKSLMLDENGRTLLKNAIIECQIKGYEIMNTNIDCKALGL